jgi:SAM-dependent methyltransferase
MEANNFGHQVSLRLDDGGGEEGAAETRVLDNGSAMTAVRPAILKALLRPVYHFVFRMHLRARFLLSDYQAQGMPQLHPPLPPALLRYRVSESLSVEDFLRVGKGCAWHIEKQVLGMGATLAEAQRVLDFGCGCGRTLRWLIESYPEIDFYGADVDADAIAWCTKNFPGPVFVNTGQEPPLPFDSGYFDVAYCFSVFTHLGEARQDSWLRELRRVLRPGGIVILTVHGDKAVKGLSSAGAEELSHKGFVHLRSRKLAGIVPDGYHTSWHSESYIVARLTTLFTDIHYTVVSDGIQDLVAARVPPQP